MSEPEIERLRAAGERLVERDQILALLRSRAAELDLVARGTHYTRAESARFAREQIVDLIERILAGEHLVTAETP